MSERFDHVVIGAGPGGVAYAETVLGRGETVAVVEAASLGGVCLNRGCIPTKGLLQPPHVDGIAARTADNQAAIDSLRVGISRQLKGATVLTGAARLLGSGQVEVAGHGQVEADTIVIATGSRPRPLVGLPVDGSYVIDSDQAVAPEHVPARLLVVGGGAVGVEFADVFEQYGATVTLVEAAARLLPAEDEWLSKQLLRGVARRDIAIRTATTVSGVTVDSAASGDNGPVRVQLQQADGSTDLLICDQVLVAGGREAVLAELNLAAVGLVPEHGFLAVDDWGRTAVSGLLAIGDVTGAPLLAHRAEAQGRRAALGPDAIDAPRLDRIPSCIYTHPQLASVGRGYAPDSGLVQAESRFGGNGMAVVTGDISGGVRLVVSDDGLLVGAQLAGVGVTEMSGLLGVLMGRPVVDIAGSVFPHPTRSEALVVAARGVCRLLADR